MYWDFHYASMLVLIWCSTRRKLPPTISPIHSSSYQKRHSALLLPGLKVPQRNYPVSKNWSRTRSAERMQEQRSTRWIFIHRYITHGHLRISSTRKLSVYKSLFVSEEVCTIITLQGHDWKLSKQNSTPSRLSIRFRLSSNLKSNMEKTHFDDNHDNDESIEAVWLIHPPDFTTTATSSIIYHVAASLVLL